LFNGVTYAPRMETAVIDDSAVLYPVAALQRIVDEAARELESLTRKYETNPLARGQYRLGREHAAENMAHYAAGVALAHGRELDQSELDRAATRLEEAKVYAATVAERVEKRGRRVADGAVCDVSAR